MRTMLFLSPVWQDRMVMTLEIRWVLFILVFRRNERPLSENISFLAIEKKFETKRYVQHWN